ncbi:MAG TPA: glycosyltransferase family 2 protein [Chitinophagaceae bacterium]|nr:glycosyltransferase family 2 protein [Chitinophagaceae bacterium]
MLSVIIVNYNVKHFLEQCLFSVMQAIKDIDAEVIVVDNASTDGSKEYFLNSSLQPGALQGASLGGRLVGGNRKTFIWNEENLGFARANNQALALAKGDLILFLNPDTIIAEDSLLKCIKFLEEHQDAGALGVHMVDGGGRFLKESKRAYPTLATSFFKLCGLASLFPKSRRFARYHLGHLDPTQTHEVDVLAGAFMMVRRKLLDQIGGFDESFFMYGEDIDLSYRIQKAGHKNFYFPGTSIIHFKGESTKRGSLNYVRMFYQAMSTFVQKHYTGTTAKIYRYAINIAIWARASITAFTGFIRHNGLPLVDGVNTLISFIAATFLWNRFIKPDTVYEKNLLMVAFPAFTLVFILVSYYAGLYDRQQRKGRVINSTLISVLIVLTLYSLLPERYRFSRGILLLGSFFSFLLLSLNRLLLRKWGWIEEEEEEKLGTVIVGTEKEFEETASLMQGVEKEQRVLGRIAVVEDGSTHLATLSNLEPFIHDVPIREIIFCQGKLSFGDIIERTTQLKDDIRIRIHACGSASIVGSDSSRSAGTTLSARQVYAIERPSARRYKRLFDVVISGIMLVGMPIHFFLVKNPAKLLRNIFLITFGKKSWVGYSTMGQGGLPVIRPGIIGTNALPVQKQRHMEEGLMMLDHLYAREYSLNRDFNLITKGYKWLGT